MEYAKSVIVFKQVVDGFSPLGKSVGGIARIETDGGVNRLFLSVINAIALERGEYFLFIVDSQRRLFYFALGARPTAFSRAIENSDFSDGFSCGLVFIESGIPEVVAFSRTEGFSLDLCDFKKIVAGECLKKKTAEDREKQKRDQQEKMQEDKPTSPYDDEAVATENYFDFGNEEVKGIDDLKECFNGRLPDENGKPFDAGKKEESQNETDDLFEQFSACADGVKEREYSRQNPYYDTAKDELETLFSKFPTESALEKLFPFSKWVRINYSTDKYYVVGVISEGGEPKYICYGVPGEYSENPPKELDGYCSFIPLSVFDMMGDGFWMMFQDAITGECVHKPR